MSSKILTELTGLFEQHLDICQETFLVDTRRPYRGDMIELRKILGESADPLRVSTISGHVLFLPFIMALDH